LEQFTRLLRALEAGDHRAIHRARVASRRLRAVLPLLDLEGPAARKIRRRLRSVTKRLGTVRELDVLAILMDELHESGTHNARALRHVANSIAEDRTRAHRRMISELPTAALRRIATKLDKMADSDRLASRPLRLALDVHVARCASALAEAVEDAGAMYLPDRVHTVRIALKKLRYAMELSTEAAGQKSTADLRLLKRVQDLLGRLHDLQVLIDRIRQVEASPGRVDLAIWRELDTVTTDLEGACRRLHARFVGVRSGLIGICERAGAKPRRSAARRAEAS
jgi:CHAD domain-containing protein